jgi:hypothetical protein
MPPPVKLMKSVQSEGALVRTGEKAVLAVDWV